MLGLLVKHSAKLPVYIIHYHNPEHKEKHMSQTIDTDNPLAPVNQLTTIICQILDAHADRIDDVNLHAPAGRQIIGKLIASQLIDGPDVFVVDPANSTDADRRFIDAALQPDSEHVYN